MSFDLFVGSFIDGKPSRFPTEVVRSAFAAFIKQVEPTCYVLQFSNDEHDQSVLFVDTQAHDVDSFSISRPSGDLRLFEGLLTVLRLRGLVLYLPGDCPPLVGNQETAEHLPPSMIEALGVPHMLTSAANIPQYIKNS